MKGDMDTWTMRFLSSFLVLIISLAISSTQCEVEKHSVYPVRSTSVLLFISMRT